MVPEFDNAIFSQKIGDTTLVQTQYGYHIIQVEERQTAHTQPLSEVLPAIQVTLIRQKEAQAEAAYAPVAGLRSRQERPRQDRGRASPEVVTTPPLNSQGVIAGLPDGSQVVAKAFTASRDGDPQFAPTGEGFAIFQVTGVTPSHAPTSPTFKDQDRHRLRR
jgi:peptidyl-prolyl cis-trans isomerase D